MTTTTIAFNNGNPFTVGTTEVHTASRVLPSTVTVLEVDLLDPQGAWVNPANAGGNFIFGAQYSPDGGTTWQIAISNGTGQPIGSVNPKTGALPSVTISGTTGLTHLYGMQIRAFAQSTKSITVGGQAVVTT